MKLKVEEITEIVGGKLYKKNDAVIESSATLKDATEKDITFFNNFKYLEDLSKTKAAAVLVPPEISRFENILNKLPCSVIFVENPLLAFSKILEIIKSEEMEKYKNKIEPKAIISKTAQLGKNLFIGPYSMIEDNVKIDDNTIIHFNCFIGENTTIGKNCIIYPNVVIKGKTKIGNNVIIHAGSVIGVDGFGYIDMADNTHKKISQVGGVEIGDDVEIGANVNIARATVGLTKIGKGTKIDNLVHIAHNVEIGENCMIAAQVGIAGSTKIGNNVVIGGQAGIKDHVTIGDNVKIGAQAGVIGDIKSGEAVSGYPARPHKKSMKIQALVNKLPEIYEEIKKWKNKKP